MNKQQTIAATFSQDGLYAATLNVQGWVFVVTANHELPNKVCTGCKQAFHPIAFLKSSRQGSEFQFWDDSDRCWRCEEMRSIPVFGKAAKIRLFLRNERAEEYKIRLASTGQVDMASDYGLRNMDLSESHEIRFATAPTHGLRQPLEFPDADLLFPPDMEQAAFGIVCRQVDNSPHAEPPFTCARCGALGEFSEAWHLCETCVDTVYGRGDPMVYVRWLLRALGQHTDREGLRDTPRRVVNMLKELCTQDVFAFTTFDAEGMDEMVVQSGIPFYSLCEHHMVPFFGTATVAYLPKEKIVGLSKLARAVKFCAAGLQNQERITTDIANMIDENLRPNGVAVVLRARHLCMELRGAKVPDVYSTTSCMRGAFRTDEKARAEFLRLAGDMR